ncbi:MAG TPA: sulfite exporter TauE/SafE family protein [Burkholderiales bacterium]|nr:sulfite exporter TauE/SafE family protein [Burkholderiales bacterium]
MDGAFLAAMAALGLASGLHCVGMCGGIVTAFGAQRGQRWLHTVVFNAGRVSTYAFAGAAAGLVGGLGWYATGGQSALYVLANVVLIFAGLHLAGLKGPMRWMESLGTPLWRRVQPLAARLVQLRTLGGAYRAGLAWGWLPCGLVYGALTASAFAGSPAGGAAGMAAFGLGTVPWLLAAGVAAARSRSWMSRRAVRLGVGGTVLGFGAWGLAHAF